MEVIIIAKIRKALWIIRRQGLSAFLILVLQKFQGRRNTDKPTIKRKIHLMVRYEDALEADWTSDKSALFKTPPVNGRPLVINWVMSPPGKGSGGHQNIFRFIRFLELAGHKCRIYLYSTHPLPSPKQLDAVLADSYPEVSAPIKPLPASNKMDSADAIFATGWETAYPVFNSPDKARRFYFVQDYEPYFYPTGSETTLATNTYRFGFYGTTAGGFLAKKLHNEFGMETDSFDFGADSDVYKHTNKEPRKEVFFYARPVTPRRAFELGVMALDIFHRQHPEYVINLAGWDVSDYELPFPYNNLKTLPLEALSAVYNRCAVALVMSLTNMSLLPLELLACGTIPVVNDGDNNRLVSNNPYIAFTPAAPKALADRMSSILAQSDLVDYSLKASQSVFGDSWDKAGEKFVSIMERELGK